MKKNINFLDYLIIFIYVKYEKQNHKDFIIKIIPDSCDESYKEYIFYVIKCITEEINSVF
jgi:hypothetical protein